MIYSYNLIVGSEMKPEDSKETTETDETSESLKDGCTDSDTMPFIPTEGQMIMCKSEDSLNNKGTEESDNVQNFHSITTDKKEQEKQQEKDENDEGAKNEDEKDKEIVETKADQC